MPGTQNHVRKTLGSGMWMVWSGGSQVLVLPLQQHIHQGIKWWRRQEGKSLREGSDCCARDWFGSNGESRVLTELSERGLMRAVLREVFGAGEWGRRKRTVQRTAGGQWDFFWPPRDSGPELQTVVPGASGGEEEVSGL